jgi:hypothetical protein
VKKPAVDTHAKPLEGTIDVLNYRTGDRFIGNVQLWTPNEMDSYLMWYDVQYIQNGNPYVSGKPVYNPDDSPD